MGKCCAVVTGVKKSLTEECSRVHHKILEHKRKLPLRGRDMCHRYLGPSEESASLGVGERWLCHRTHLFLLREDSFWFSQVKLILVDQDGPIAPPTWDSVPQNMCVIFAYHSAKQPSGATRMNTYLSILCLRESNETIGKKDAQEPLCPWCMSKCLHRGELEQIVGVVAAGE